MSIERRNLALPAIMAVATLIVLNAVVGQDGNHPAPLGKGASYQKITKSPPPVSSSQKLRRKSAGTKAVATNTTKPKGDAIGQLLRSVEKNQTSRKIAKAELLGDKKVRFVQMRLEQLGYSPGPVDGVIGAKTREAIRKFEGDRHLPVTGDLSRPLIDALSRGASFASLKLT